MDIRRIQQVGGIVGVLVLGYIIFRAKRPNDIKLLKRPLTVIGIRKVQDPTKRKDIIESRLDDKKSMVLCELVLSANTIRSMQYRLVDSPDDGYFPNDSDGLVDRVSKRNIFSRRDRWSKRLYSRTPWTKIPFETELYQIATERYKEALAKINSSPGSEIGIKIGM